MNKKLDGKVYEYAMSPELANYLLAEKKRKHIKGDPQSYLCNWVNNNRGMMGTCVYVSY